MATARRRSLASRLVLLGLAQLVLLAIAAVAVVLIEGPHEEERPDRHIDEPRLHQLEGLVATPDQLGEALEKLHDEGVEVTIYSDKKVLVATNVDPPLAIPERRHRPPPGMRPDDFPPPPMIPPPDEEFHAHGPPPGGFHGGPPPEFYMGNHSMVAPFMVADDARGLFVARGVHQKPTLLGPVLGFAFALFVVILASLITARWIVRPIETLSQTARAIGAGDLSARANVRRGDEIGELGDRMDEMAERLSGLIASEKELLANVAHELRTPLARIGVALDLANEGDADAARASLAEIHVDVNELGTIIDDILMAMRFEVDAANEPGRSFPLRREVVNARTIADAAVDRIRVRHGNRELVADIGAALPDVDVDPRLFRRVIDNLLENAHKYTPDPDRPIELSVSKAAAGAVTFEVRDRGLGISAADLPRVFTAFFRGDRSRSRETGGVGLGLTLAKRLVEAHGGTITVASKVGEGTTVRVTIPGAH